MKKRSCIYQLVVILLLTTLIFNFGCDRHIESKFPVRSLPDRPLTPFNIVTQLGDRSVTISWEISDPGTVSRYRIYKSTNDIEYLLHDSTTNMSIQLSSLPLSQLLYFKVSAVSVDGIEGDRSPEVKATLGLLSLLISNNDKYVNNRNVQIQLNIPGTGSYVELSEDSLFNSGSVPEQFRTNVSFELSQGDGSKRVFAKFIYTDGTESDSPVFDDIILDTEALIDSVYYTPVQSTFAPGDTIFFYVKTTETGGNASVSFAGVSNITLHDDGLSGDSQSDDGLYSVLHVIPFGVMVNSAQVKGDFSDEAGNGALQALGQNLLNIRSNPLPVQITAINALSSFEISLRWSPSSSSDFSLYRIYRDTENTISENSTLIKSVNQISSTEFTDTTLTDNAFYYYRVYVVDNFGLTTGSNVDSTSTLLNAAPEAVTLAVTLKDSSTAGLTWTKNLDRDFQSYRIYRSTNAGVSSSSNLVTIISDKNRLTYDDFVIFPVGVITSYYYKVYVHDRHTAMTGSNEVSVTR